MIRFVRNFHKAWRLAKLIDGMKLSDEEILDLEKVDTLYTQECAEIKSSLNKTRKSAICALKSWKNDNNSRLGNLEDSFNQSIDKISQLLESSLNSLARRLGEVDHSSKTTQELVDNVREYVSKQADETRRWQEGYDWRLLKNYLLRILSTLDEIEDKIEYYRKQEKPAEFINDFNFFKEMLEEHLEEEGVFSFTPKINAELDDFKNEVMASQPSESADQVAGTIASVIRRGFELEIGDDVKVIRKSRVSIFKK